MYVCMYTDDFIELYTTTLKWDDEKKAAFMGRLGAEAKVTYRDFPITGHFPIPGQGTDLLSKLIVFRKFLSSGNYPTSGRKSRNSINLLRNSVPGLESENGLLLENHGIYNICTYHHGDGGRHRAPERDGR